MIINGKALLAMCPIVNMLNEKHTAHGVSHGLGEAGYDIRIKQTICFMPRGWQDNGHPLVSRSEPDDKEDGVNIDFFEGRFVLASAIEKFDMPNNLVGVVHDKSSWARRGLSVFNTVIEPGWKGFLTLELVYHGHEKLVIPAGAGIAQVLFHETLLRSRYEGKYQNQADKPIKAIKE